VPARETSGLSGMRPDRRVGKRAAETVANCANCRIRKLQSACRKFDALSLQSYLARIGHADNPSLRTQGESKWRSNSDLRRCYVTEEVTMDSETAVTSDDARFCRGQHCEMPRSAVLAPWQRAANYKVTAEAVKLAVKNRSGRREHADERNRIASDCDCSATCACGEGNSRGSPVAIA
jgi:hypothetical protein